MVHTVTAFLSTEYLIEQYEMNINQIREIVKGTIICLCCNPERHCLEYKDTTLTLSKYTECTYTMVISQHRIQ